MDGNWLRLRLSILSGVELGWVLTVARGLAVGDVADLQLAAHLEAGGLDRAHSVSYRLLHDAAADVERALAGIVRVAGVALLGHQHHALLHDRATVVPDPGLAAGEVAGLDHVRGPHDEAGDAGPDLGEAGRAYTAARHQPVVGVDLSHLISHLSLLVSQTSSGCWSGLRLNFKVLWVCSRSLVALTAMTRLPSLSVIT